MLSEKDFINTVEQHQQILFKVCNMYMDTKADREDLFQEILLNAWKGSKNFKGDSKFSTWLYSVALNTAISFFKKEKKIQLTLDSASITHLHDPSDVQQEQLEAMNKAIAELSAIDKAIVMLYLEDYSYRHVAEIMGITANNVAVKMNRIKTILKESSKKHLHQ